uniref:Leucine rich repeat containing 61 n=1 Tax=Anolis carolinensis TaxID=28377 RepID=A0A803TV66_ANOCA
KLARACVHESLLNQTKATVLKQSRLRGLGISDLGCLGECAGLEWLDLSGNAISHLGPLSSLKALAVLNISSNRVSSLEPLAGCENLQSLNAAGNLLGGVQHLQCLAGLRHLENMQLLFLSNLLYNMKFWCFICKIIT